MAARLLQMIAGGDIRPCRFVKVSTAANHTLLEADAGELPIGIAGQAAKEAPQDGSDTKAAEANDHVEWFGIGEVALLELGSGGCTAGAVLKSDADGKGVAASAGDKFGAISAEAGSAGELVEVQIIIGELET
jgi:hypothetical protein